MSGLSHFDEKSGVVECRTEWGRWHQTAHEVTIEVDVEEGTRGKEVRVDVAPRLISCVVRQKEIFKGEPFDTVTEDDSTWTLEDRKLVRIVLTKANPRKDSCWESLLADGRFAPDPLITHEMRKKLDLEQFQIENPGFDFSNAKLDKRYDDKYVEDIKRIAESSDKK